MNQYIVKMPSGVDFQLMPTELQQAIHQLKGQWPSAIMSGTREYDGKVLLLALASADRATVEQFITDWSLPWEVIADDSEQVDGESILDWIVDTPIIDENGDVVGAERPITCPPLQHYAGLPSWKIV